MLHQAARKSNRISFLFAIMVFFVGCATPGKYVLKNSPTTNPKSFKNIEVTKVEVGITESELEPETPIDLRTVIIQEIQKKKLFEQVASEFGVDEATLQIQPKIVQFDKGSQAARYFLGFGAGKAHLDVDCKFVNKTTQETIAEGTFVAELKGGFFGGSANQKSMSQNVAKQVVKFLKKGK